MHSQCQPLLEAFSAVAPCVCCPSFLLNQPKQSEGCCSHNEIEHLGAVLSQVKHRFRGSPWVRHLAY